MGSDAHDPPERDILVPPSDISQAARLYGTEAQMLPDMVRRILEHLGY